MIYKQSKDIIIDGEVVYSLNRYLLSQQGITEEALGKLKSLHVDRCKILIKMRDLDSTEKTALRELADKITLIDFDLQSLWGFDQDKNFHKWWELPYCICPQLDNRDNYGTKYRIIAGECPIHGE